MLAGTPAAVMVLERFLDDALMQAIAAENNLSETAFLVPERGDYQLRWFTPTTRGRLRLLHGRECREMTVFKGSCHCGAVRFSVDSTITELTTCDCSLCTRRNALMAKVPQEALKVLAGEERLSCYQWNTRRAKHYFCERCGIYVFHRKRAAPDHFGINVFCLDDFDATSLPVRATEGANMSITDPLARPEWPGPRD